MSGCSPVTLNNDTPKRDVNRGCKGASEKGGKKRDRGVG